MQVGIIMGSTSDWPTMKHAADMLDKFGIAYETKVVSAHRTPQLLADYASSAASRRKRSTTRARWSEWCTLCQPQPCISSRVVPVM